MPRAKVTPDQVLVIRDRLARGESAHDLAEEFGLSPHSIYDIASRQTWVGVRTHRPGPDQREWTHGHLIWNSWSRVWQWFSNEDTPATKDAKATDQVEVTRRTLSPLRSSRLDR
ncbi:MAG: hypothetical protein HYR72_26975 [Deltaproteobacteria bacterium]|nr:hypothetical protein [Deltaproteobacteria bacterium]MBI3390342.1 hypothetical protein [Deltaproteobacteria bacterium]